MKYTKEQLQSMSDLEINKALAVLSGWRIDNWQNNELSSALVVRKHCDGITRTCVDYCNNWNDVMPLAVEHNISPLSMDDEIVATNNYPGYVFASSRWFKENGGKSFTDDKMQRAIACCLILVLQDKQ